jgi:hypothetical protein
MIDGQKAHIEPKITSPPHALTSSTVLESPSLPSLYKFTANHALRHDTCIVATSVMYFCLLLSLSPYTAMLFFPAYHPNADAVPHVTLASPETQANALAVAQVHPRQRETSFAMLHARSVACMLF